ncbi:MAG: LysR family transcriptional regulator [Clostridiales bacterium]|nr:LysR family transcriptional regulator [Clostridiales bacterium]
MLINYEHYRIFYYVAKYQNITQAAAALMSSQPNVTRTIKQMEKKFGCALFVRTARGVKLTAEGEKLYEHVAVAYDHIEAGEKELTGRLTLQEGAVAIGTGEVALHLLLLKKLSEFHTLYPKVRLKITNGSTPQSLKALDTGAVDFSVVTESNEMSPQMKSIPLCSFREILICGSQYRSLADKTIGFGDLAKLPYVCLDRTTITYKFYRNLFLSEGQEMNPDIEVATSDMILPVVENNLGIGFVPEQFAAQPLKEGRVYKINMDKEIPQRHICMVKDKGRSLSAAADRLASYLSAGRLSENP